MAALRISDGSCLATHCPVDDIGTDRAFCTWHWDVLPVLLKTKLSECVTIKSEGLVFVSTAWNRVLAECVKALREYDGY